MSQEYIGQNVKVKSSCCSNGRSVSVQQGLKPPPSFYLCFTVEATKLPRQPPQISETPNVSSIAPFRVQYCEQSIQGTRLCDLFPFQSEKMPGMMSGNRFGAVLAQTRVENKTTPALRWHRAPFQTPKVYASMASACTLKAAFTACFLSLSNHHPKALPHDNLATPLKLHRL